MFASDARRLYSRQISLKENETKSILILNDLGTTLPINTNLVDEYPILSKGYHPLNKKVLLSVTYGNEKFDFQKHGHVVPFITTLQNDFPSDEKLNKYATDYLSSLSKFRWSFTFGSITFGSFFIYGLNEGISNDNPVLGISLPVLGLLAMIIIPQKSNNELKSIKNDILNYYIETYNSP